MARGYIYSQMGLGEQAIENFKKALPLAEFKDEVYLALGVEFLNEDGTTVRNASKIPLLSRIKKLMRNRILFGVAHGNNQLIALSRSKLNQCNMPLVDWHKLTND